MSIFDEARIDGYAHIFKPLHYPYREDSFYKPTGQELGTPPQLRRRPGQPTQPVRLHSASNRQVR
ncbi:MAG: hypothetical protein JSR83_20915 [Proteobacteria bacterium]|nr:hypothetical protein [Pseudomonadota bacterium]